MRIRSILMVMVVLASPQLAHAEPASESALSTLYALSGIETQIRELPSTFRSQLEQEAAAAPRSAPGDDRVLSVMQLGIDVAFAPARLDGLIFDGLRDRLTEDDVQSAIAWLSTDAGKGIVTGEIAAASMDGQADILRFAAQLRHRPIATERLDLLRRLDAAMNATDAAVEYAVVIAGALGTAFDGGERVGTKALKKRLNVLRPQIEAAARQGILLKFAYTYQSVSLTDLRSYVDFGESPAGRAYFEAKVSSVLAALVDASVEWVNFIADGMKEGVGERDT